MKTKGRMRLGDWARMFWAGFVAGLILFACFIFVRTSPFSFSF
ncbi:MAG: hypothetical protein ABI383_13200 [Acidobacteriaceae bacterium]